MAKKVKCSCGKECSGKKIVKGGKTYCCSKCLTEQKSSKKSPNTCEFC